MTYNILQLDNREPVTTPILLVYRFRVHRVKSLQFMAEMKHRRYINFGVYGGSEEYFEVRVFLNDEQYIENVKTYHYRGCDNEIIEYVVKAIVQWLSRKIRKTIKVKHKNK